MLQQIVQKNISIFIHKSYVSTFLSIYISVKIQHSFILYNPSVFENKVLDDANEIVTDL